MNQTNHTRDAWVFVGMLILTLLTATVWTYAIHTANKYLLLTAIGLSGVLVICIAILEKNIKTMEMQAIEDEIPQESYNEEKQDVEK